MATLIEEKPVFDFDELSWGDVKAMETARASLSKASAEGDTSAITAAFECLEAIIGPLVISVPRSWLVKRAPAVLDFTQPGSFNYLKGQRFEDIVNCLATLGKEADENSKNSPKP